jgi:hypothetical protein
MELKKEGPECCANPGPPLLGQVGGEVLPRRRALGSPGLRPLFLQRTNFCISFHIVTYLLQNSNVFFISFHIVKYLLQNSNVIYHVCGMLKAVETKNYMFGFPNAILNFFFAADTFPRYFNIYIFWVGYSLLATTFLMVPIYDFRRMSEFECCRSKRVRY